DPVFPLGGETRNILEGFAKQRDPGRGPVAHIRDLRDRAENVLERLFRRLGFQRIKGPPDPFDRLLRFLAAGAEVRLELGYGARDRVETGSALLRGELEPR